MFEDTILITILGLQVWALIRQIRPMHVADNTLSTKSLENPQQQKMLQSPTTPSYRKSITAVRLADGTYTYDHK